MENKIIHFEIVTPERVVLKEEILQVTVPTREGEITVLANHIPLVASLMPGIIEVKTKESKTEVMSTSGGFIEVLRDKVVILADTAEMAHEIDESRAEEARRRAEELKKRAINQEDVNFTEIAAKIEKELARSKAVRRWKKMKNL